MPRRAIPDLIRPVGVGLLIGGGSAAGLAALLLATPAAATIGEIVHVLDPVASTRRGRFARNRPGPVDTCGQ